MGSNLWRSYIITAIYEHHSTGWADKVYYRGLAMVVICIIIVTIVRIRFVSFRFLAALRICLPCYRKKFNNVRPWVARNPPCRNESIVRGSQISPSRISNVMVSLLLFFNHFSVRIGSPTRKTPRSCYDVDRPFYGV